MPSTTLHLIAANVVVFLAQLVSGQGVPLVFALWPNGGFLPWQLITYAFLHGGWLHLLFNMVGIAVMGSELERLWGRRRYLICYFYSVIGGALTQIIVARLTHAPTQPVIGASAGVFGLLLAFAWFFPQRRLMLLFPPIPMPARTFAVVFAVMELLFGVTGAQSGIAHFAHLGGMIGAYLSITQFRTKPGWNK